MKVRPNGSRRRSYLIIRRRYWVLSILNIITLRIISVDMSTTRVRQADVLTSIYRRPEALPPLLLHLEVNLVNVRLI